MIWRNRAALLAAMLLAITPASAGAHAALVRSTPARKASLAHPPPRIELTFSERLEPAYSTVSVLDAGGRQVDLRDAALAPGDSRRLVVSLPPLPTGTYTVRFRVLSVDGHVVESDFPFTIATRGGDR